MLSAGWAGKPHHARALSQRPAIARPKSASFVFGISDRSYDISTPRTEVKKAIRRTLLRVYNIRTRKGRVMPDKATLERARRDKAEGKSASTQAGEFVRAEIDKIRRGEHGAASTKQAIAIGLSEARRAGVKLPAPRRGSVSPRTRKSIESATRAAKTHRRPSPKRSRATLAALKRKPRSVASRAVLSRQAKAAAKRRSPASRSAAARKAASTRRKEAR